MCPCCSASMTLNKTSVVCMFAMPNLCNQIIVYFLFCLLQPVSQPWEEEPWDVWGFQPVSQQHRWAGATASSKPGLSVYKMIHTLHDRILYSLKSVTRHSTEHNILYAIICQDLIESSMQESQTYFTTKPACRCACTHAHNAGIHICCQGNSTAYCFTSCR